MPDSVLGTKREVERAGIPAPVQKSNRQINDRNIERITGVHRYKGLNLLKGNEGFFYGPVCFYVHRTLRELSS